MGVYLVVVTWGWRIEGTSDATEIDLVLLGSVVVRTPVVVHCADASYPLANWSFDSGPGFFSLRSLAKREEAEVAGTYFVAAAAVVAAAVVAAVVVVEATSAIVVVADWPV